MKRNNKPGRELSDVEIDEIVTAQADGPSFWEEAVTVHPPTPTLKLPVEVVAKAAYISSVLKAGSIDEWLIKIIKERLEAEETLIEAKRAKAVRKSA